MASLAELLAMIGLSSDRSADIDPKTGRRMASAPTQTLGGKRMEGSRPMTEQEQTITDAPWRQMGRDAGAAASQAINTAGFGIPGVVVDMAAPEVARAIRENEGRATGMANVGGAALGMVGPGGLAKEGASRMAGLLARHPVAGGGTIAATAGLAAPSEANREAAANDYIPKGLFSEASDAMSSALKAFGFGDGPSADDKPMTLDEYKKQRATLKPKTLSDLEQDAVDKLKATDERYKTWGPAGRARLEEEARKGAQKTYAAYQQDVAAEGKRLESAYGDYRKGWDDQRTEHLNKQFTERHPKVAMGMTVGGPALSALLTKGVFSKINSKADDIVTKGAEARTADNMRDLADQITRADQFGWRGNVGKGVAATEAVLLPAELRMMQDVIDKKGLPPESGARKAAEQRMSDVVEYGKGMGWDLFSGTAGAGTGALWSKMRTPYPGADLATLKSHARGMDIGNMAPDSMAQALATRAILAREAQNKLNAVPKTAIEGLAPPSNGGTLSPAPLPQLPAPSASVQGGVQAPQLTSPAGASAGRAANPNQSQIPVPVANQPRSFADVLTTEDLARIVEQEASKPKGHWELQPRKDGKFSGPPKYPKGEKPD